MKRYLRGCLLLCLLFTISLMTAYNHKNIEEPRMKIIAGGREIQVIYYRDRYNKSIEEIEKNLVKFMKNGDLEDLPYIDLNEIHNIRLYSYNNWNLSL
jgi:Zn/Cd-binding protein ZinT